MAIKVYPFRPWTFVIVDGSEFSCDTLDEVLYLSVNLLKEGEKATITKNSHVLYLERVKTVEDFNKHQAEEPVVLVPGEMKPQKTVTVGAS